VKKIIIGEYLAKLQARAWLSHALCAPGQHTAKRRRECTRQSRFRVVSCIVWPASQSNAKYIPCPSVTQSLSWEIGPTVERLLEVHKAHHIYTVEWLLVLPCLQALCISILRFVICSLVPFLVGIPPVSLQFPFRSSLGSFPV